jgi:hypothetical protein
MYRIGLFILMVSGATAFTADPMPTVVKVGTLSGPAPKNWVAEKPTNRLRSFQFKISSGEEGVTDGELIVMPESSPKADKEFPRWKASFTPPDGKTIDDVSKESKLEVGGASLQLLDVRGTWKFKERPFDPKSKEESRAEYRVIWVIVTQKDETTHVRFSGPEKLVEKHKPAFDEWLKALK